MGIAADGAPRLSVEQGRLFAAAADRVLPGVVGPGATAAGVLGYFERLWDEPAFQPSRVFFARGLAWLDELSVSLHSVPFADASASQRDAVLRQLEAIPHPTARRFLVSLVRVSLAGYLCHPLHGGNHRGVAWQDLGIDWSRQPQETSGMGSADPARSLS